MTADASRITLASGAGQSAVRVSGLAAGRTPSMEILYSDGAGGLRQAQVRRSAAKVIVDHEILYDRLQSQPSAAREEGGRRRPYRQLRLRAGLRERPRPASGDGCGGPIRPIQSAAACPASCRPGAWRRTPRSATTPITAMRASISTTTPCGGPRRSPRPGEAYRVGSRLLTRFDYGQDSDTAKLHGGRTGLARQADARCGPRHQPLGQDDRTTAIGIVDGFGRPLISGEGYGADPFGAKSSVGLDFRVIGFDQRFTASGNSVGSSRMPNYYGWRRGALGHDALRPGRPKPTGWDGHCASRTRISGPARRSMATIPRRSSRRMRSVPPTASSSSRRLTEAAPARQRHHCRRALGQEAGACGNRQCRSAPRRAAGALDPGSG